jgi:hypothetical protein
VFELDNITRGSWEVDFFDNIKFVWVFELVNITAGIGQLEFVDEIKFV